MALHSFRIITIRLLFEMNFQKINTIRSQIKMPYLRNYFGLMNKFNSSFVLTGAPVEVTKPRGKRPWPEFEAGPSIL